MATTITATIDLYSNTEITREKNRQFDSMTKALAQLVSSHQSVKKTYSIQYFKHGFRRTLKLNIDQIYLDASQSGANFDYCLITNQNEHDGRYYFIVGKKWIAESTIQLELVEDTINTFNGKYTFSDKTTIIRQHENRFFLQNNYMRRKIDIVSEDFNAPLYKTRETYVNNKGNFVISQLETEKGYLIYANEYDPPEANQTVPLKCFYCYSKAKRVLLGYTDSETMTGQTGIMYDIEGIETTNKNSARIKILVTNNSNDEPVWFDLYFDGIRYHTAATYVDNGKRYIKEISYTKGGSLVKGSPVEVKGGVINYYTRTTTFKYQNDCYIGYRIYDDTYTSETQLPTTVIRHIVNTPEKSVIHGIDALDRANLRLQKVIELPYNIIYLEEVEIDDLTYQSLMDTDLYYGFVGDAQYLQVCDMAKHLSSELYHEDVLDNIKSGFNNTPVYYETANIINESKLYKSDYYVQKFVYDSFSYTFELERADGYSEEKTSFHPTTTVNSKFAFMFDWDMKDENKDFSKVLLVSRNNELTIYNSAYVSYVKTGYNYDVKTRENAQQISYITAALQIAAGSAAAALGAETGGISGAVGVSLASQGINALINTEVTYQNSILAQLQKMEELKNQGTSVSGSDDLDLLNAYCGNKARIMTYETSEAIKNALYTLFRFYGYKSNKRGVPNTTSRIWYNFIQCEPVFSETTNIDEEELNDIIARYKEGVTVMHYDEDNQYDFTQHYENWETFLPGHHDPSPNPLDDLFEEVGTVGSGTGEWTLTPPTYGYNGTTMAPGQYFKYIICLGSTTDPTYTFTAEDGFGNTYQFIPQVGGYKVVMTRLSDQRQFEEIFTVNKLYRLTSALHTTNVSIYVSIAEPYMYAMEATRNL